MRDKWVAARKERPEKTRSGKDSSCRPSFRTGLPSKRAGFLRFLICFSIQEANESDVKIGGICREDGKRLAQLENLLDRGMHAVLVSKLRKHGEKNRVVRGLHAHRKHPIPVCVLFCAQQINAVG